MSETLQADGLRRVVTVFRDLLDAHREVINRLNVYPVPDGDTGTNMALTLRSVVEELDDAGGDMEAVSRAIGHGSLMGARGNSGVILSQILRGFTGELSGHDEVEAKIVAQAFTSAATAAYGAVGKPVEGTILTVVREAAEAGQAAADRGAGLVDVLDAASAQGHDALRRTPEMLPVLADAGVVDAGGTGLLLLFDAALHVLDGRALPEAPDLESVPEASPTRPDVHGEGGDISDLRYEVMYLLEAPDEAIPAFKDVWAGIGDSIVVVGGEGLFNCHIHTDDIGASIEAALDIGRPRQIRVTDLAEQVEELPWVVAGASAASAEPEPDPVDCAIVAVSPAEGIGRIFHSLRVQQLVSGGQTMNPSTEQLLASVEAAPAPEVVILPNNGNIIAVARQVDELTDKAVRVVPTRSVVEGFAALLAYDPFQSGEANVEGMQEAADAVATGEVVQAVRDSSSPVGPVEEGDWLGILDGDGIRAVAPSVEEAAIRLLTAMVGDDHELVTIIEGDGASAAITRQIRVWLSEQRPDVEIEIHQGGQPHYPYLLGVE
ncbi:MAG: DAK2 domain-containing protein [Actinomycetota bacterium]